MDYFEYFDLDNHQIRMYNIFMPQTAEIFSGLIVNRFSKDVYFMDERFPYVSYEFAQLFLLYSGIHFVIPKQIVSPNRHVSNF